MRKTEVRAVESRIYDDFGGAALGDARRTSRVVSMAKRVSCASSGKVSAVFKNRKEREGAYDLLESKHLDVHALANSMFAATALRAKAAGTFAYVIIDGSSLNLTERTSDKGFGRVGTDAIGARGLKVMSAYCVAPNGTPLGIVEQQFWARPASLTPGADRKEKKRVTRNLPAKSKEPYRFTTSAEAATKLLNAQGVRPWILVDREGDNRDLLKRLSELDCHFTVRASFERCVADTKLCREVIRQRIGREKVVGTYEVEIPRNGSRKARKATMQVQVASTELLMPDQRQKTSFNLPMNVVWVQETVASQAKSGQPALDWLLYTNASVTTLLDAEQIVKSYAYRWKIEEFHRTWKTGTCNVEESQLRSYNAMVAWATILAANAARVENIKHVARTEPQAPARIIFSSLEIATLVALRKQEEHDPKKRSLIPDAPNALEATKWIATIGGWNPSKHPPGSITISRGLEVLRHMVAGFELAKSLML
jgi:Transposase DDE domain/Transposase DNA-binding